MGSSKAGSSVQSDLDAIKARDKASGALWFTGPESFTALAARDRRALLAMLEEAQAAATWNANMLADANQALEKYRGK